MVVYVAISILLMVGFREDWTTLLQEAGRRSWQFFEILKSWLILAGIGVCILIITVGLPAMKDRANNIVYAILACAIFPSAFTLTKTSLPYILPFFADPDLASFDNWLHLGHDPWQLVWGAVPYLMNEAVISSYIIVWSLLAMFSPVILATVDGDQTRIMRFLIMYLVAWIVLGNFVALAGMSVGPIYYDRLLGTERFADLLQALKNTPITDSIFSDVQDELWRVYVEDSQSFGAGISAFPSVHISSTTVTALYLAERSRWLIIPALIMVLYVFFIAVVTGFHYAVDGYFSIIVIVGVWLLLRKYWKPDPAVSDIVQGHILSGRD